MGHPAERLSRVQGPVDGQSSARPRQRFAEGPWLAVCLCIGLVLLVLMLIHDPRLIARNAATQSLGLAPAAPATTTTTTTAPAPTTTTTTTDPAAPVDPRTTPSTETTAPSVAPAAATTTTAPAPTTTTTTTTTAPVYVPPHIASQTEPGSLGWPDPGVVSSAYPVTTTGGVVQGTGTWSGAPELSITVACSSGPNNAQQGSSGLSVSATCPAGPATVTIAEVGTSTPTVSYNLVLSYPATTG